MIPRLVCSAIVVAGVSLYAQKTTTPTPTPTKPTTGLPTPTTNNSNNNPLSNPNSNTINTMPRPIFLSGKVVLQDGTPPPEIVKIERVCGGTPRPQGYTDTKGRFQFQVDSAIGIEQDASDPLGRSGMTGNRPTSGFGGRNDLTGCDLRAVLPGFVSGMVSLVNHSSFDDSDVGVIVLRRLGNVEGTTISMSSLHAPKEALKAYEKGRELLKKEKAEEAEKSFQKAVDLYPGYATAWYQLGLLQARGNLEQAEVSFNRSVEADPKFVNPYLSLALICERSRRWEKALQLSETIIRLNGTEFPVAHFYKAVAQYNLHDETGAEKSVLKAIEVDLRHENPQSEKLLGVILAQRNDLAGGAEHLRKYLELAPRANDVNEVKMNLAKIEKQSVASKEP